MNTPSSLWQAVHSAYESHDIAEARRLLHSDKELPDCKLLIRCGEEDYIRWLLSNDLLPLQTINKSDWPELQEIQLQCSSLSEEARPDCILEGNLPHSDTENSNTSLSDKNRTPK